MKAHTFTDWLYSEVMSSRNALLTLYERIDKMRFVEAPQLEQQYMEQVGSVEEEIIQQEIECELLEEKKNMVQTAINRREPVDEAAIDAKIDAMRQEKLTEAVGTVPNEVPCHNLTGEQTDALQDLYRQIVQHFHPQMHPEMTQNQKELFAKAQDAYRRRDMTALQLIYDMLSSTEGEPLNLTVTFELTMGDGDGETEKRVFSTDYTLAKRLYNCFVPTAEEAAIQEEWKSCQEKQVSLMQQVEELKQEFPFNAAEMLADPEQIEAYKQQLQHRRFEAEQSIRKLEVEIQSMMERVKVHG